jgi:putative aldouronate transport system permease protein
MQQILVLYNPVVYSTGDVIGTFVYRVGLTSNQFSLGAAVGLMQSVVGLVLITLSYYLARRFANYRIF